MSPEQTKTARRGNRRAGAEAEYISAMSAYQAVPLGIEHAEVRCKAGSAVKAAERALVDSLWTDGELAQVLDLGCYVQSACLELMANAVMIQDVTYVS